MDAVDVALCAFDDAGRLEAVRATHSATYPETLRRQLLQLQADPARALSLHDWMGLDEGVATTFARTAQELLARIATPASAIAVVGSHGQTVFHDPQGIGSSLQLGNPSRIATILGITTVGDFRRADIALGGQGAPLVPAFHHALFADAEPRAVLNLGGIGNLTLMPGTDPAQVTGFDTGPANALMDEWSLQCRGQAYDADGAWAASGEPHEGLIQALLADPYFVAPPPKSTGRDRFNLRWALQRYAGLTDLPAADVQRSFAELTVRSVTDALLRHAPATRRLLICGGGARNGFLKRLLGERLPGLTIVDTDAHGLDAQWVEAAAFAWLGWRALKGLPGNLPAVTGARRPAVLGGLYRP